MRERRITATTRYASNNRHALLLVTAFSSKWARYGQSLREKSVLPLVRLISKCFCAWGFLGGQGVNRTLDTRIFSPLLYRLSYLPTVIGRVRDEANLHSYR
jgi:hypothetical protein